MVLLTGISTEDGQANRAGKYTVPYQIRVEKYRLNIQFPIKFE